MIAVANVELACWAFAFFSAAMRHVLGGTNPQPSSLAYLPCLTHMVMDPKSIMLKMLHFPRKRSKQGNHHNFWMLASANRQKRATPFAFVTQRGRLSRNTKAGLGLTRHTDHCCT